MGKTFLNRLGLVIAITAFAAVAGEAAAQTGNRHIVEVGEARTTVTVKVWLPVEPITFHPHALAGRWKGLPATLPDVISHPPAKPIGKRSGQPRCSSTFHHKPRFGRLPTARQGAPLKRAGALPVRAAMALDELFDPALVPIN